MIPWLTVVGFGEDGIEGLSPAARHAVAEAEVLVGGTRHLAKVPESKAERLDWGNGFQETLERLAALRGRRVVVLASGDPMNFGAGVSIAKRFDAGEYVVIPNVGAFSLAAARLGWSLPDVETLTLHGRPVDMLNLYLAPNARLLILAEDGATPAAVARLLVARGYGPSVLTVLEHMGGANERRLDGIAATWPHSRTADLNTIAVECRADAGAKTWARVPGLPEEAFEHDGQITKREVRAATLARLMPLPHQVLWDVGAGSGAIAIEWLRAERLACAVAIEREPARAAAIRRNAANLGVPYLKVVEGAAPEALAGLAPAPDAVFVGGGIARAGVLDVCWDALKPGGRLVANAVTLEAERALIDFRSRVGGEIVRLSISREEPVGSYTGLRPLMTVTQLAAVKG
jgi:precorrin-6Y C5,15-methyltransferase (decarboxylating)